MSDTPESIRKLATELGEQEYTIAGNLSYEALKRYAELLERSAGVWVPVGEKLPEDGDYDCTTIARGGDVFNEYLHLQRGVWWGGVGRVTHWLDVKLPGEQHE